MIVSMIADQKYKVKEKLCRKFQWKTGIEVQSKDWGGNRQLSMEGIAVEYFMNSINPGSNKKQWI